MGDIAELLDACITGVGMPAKSAPVMDLSKIEFEALIDSYNAGSRNIEERARHVRENMTEEELVSFDILTRPAPELSTEERTAVKKVPANPLLAEPLYLAKYLEP
jgi:hypothetical protein